MRLFWPHDDGSLRRPTPVDVFLPQHELHDIVAGRTQLVPMLDAHVPIISATDLCVFKALFSRPKDWGDITALLAGGEVDVDEVRAWLTRIVGAGDDRFRKLDEAGEEALRPEPVARDLFRPR